MIRHEIRDACHSASHLGLTVANAYNICPNCTHNLHMLSQPSSYPVHPQTYLSIFTSISMDQSNTNYKKITEDLVGIQDTIAKDQSNTQGHHKSETTENSVAVASGSSMDQSCTQNAQVVEAMNGSVTPEGSKSTDQSNSQHEQVTETTGGPVAAVKGGDKERITLLEMESNLLKIALVVASERADRAESKFLEAIKEADLLREQLFALKDICDYNLSGLETLWVIDARGEENQ